MSIFKEMKKTKEWEQWDTQFRADVTTQGLSNIQIPILSQPPMMTRYSLESSNIICMLSLSVFSRWIKGRPSSANTRVPTTPRVFIVNFRSTLPSLLKPSLMPTPYSSISPLQVSVIEWYD